MVSTDIMVEPQAQATASKEMGCEQCGRRLRRGWGFVFKVNRATEYLSKGRRGHQVH